MPARLRKSALRRLAAAEPAVPPPLTPQPPSQPANQPHSEQGTVPQAAPGAKQGWRDNPPLWPIKLFTLGVCLFTAVSAFQHGNHYTGWASLVTVLFILLPPWSHME